MPIARGRNTTPLTNLHVYDGVVVGLVQKKAQKLNVGLFGSHVQSGAAALAVLFETRQKRMSQDHQTQSHPKLQRNHVHLRFQRRAHLQQSAHALPEQLPLLQQRQTLSGGGRPVTVQLLHRGIVGQDRNMEGRESYGRKKRSASFTLL